MAAPNIETYKRDTLATDADGDGVPSPGDTLTYSVTVRNTGNMAASAVEFNDTPGANTQLVVGSVTTTQGAVALGNSAGNSSVQVIIGTLSGANAEVTIQFNVTIDNPLPAGVTQVANQGITTATGLPAVPSDDPATPAGGDPTVTPVSAAPALDATKSDALLSDADGNGSPSPGDTLVYTVTIINAGNTAATGIDFTDTPDPNTALVVGSVTTSQGTISTGNNGGDATIAVAVGALAGNGGQATIAFHVTIDNPVAAGVTQVSNQGLVASNELPTLPTDDPATPAINDPTDTPITAAPVLNSTKSDLLSIDADGNGVVSPGDTLLYNITIINSGNSNTTGVIFSDIPDVNTALIVGSVATDLGTVTTGNSAGDATVAVAIGAIPGAGGQVNISFEVTIDNPLSAGVTQVSNQGLTSSNELPVNPTDDPATPTMADPTDTPIVAAPMIDSFKTDTLLIDADGNGAASPGDTLLYNVTIINQGNAAATGVVFTDSPDANTTLVVGSVSSSAGTVTTGNGAGNSSVGVDIGALPGGNAQVDISYEVTINNPLPAGVTQIINQGLTASNELPNNLTDDPDDPTIDDPTDTPIVAAPVLAAAKRDQLFVDADGDNLPSPGDTLVYLITIINDGNQAATNLIFTDAPDPFTTLVGGSVQTDLGAVTTGNNGGDATVAIDIGTLPGGGSQVDISFEVTINNPLPAGITQVSNQGIVFSNELPDELTDDPDVPVLDDPTDTPIIAAPIIEGFKQDSLLVDADNDGAPSPGDTLLYNITIMNTGNSAATGVLFDDNRPANTQLEIGSVNASLGAITSGNNSDDSRVTVDIGTLPGGSQVDISFNVIIANPLPTGVSQISNQGGITSNELPPEPTDDLATGPDDDPTLTPVTTNPALDAFKRASHLVDADANGIPSPGDTVLYNITIKNTGNVPLTNLAYNDTPDANTTLVVGTVATNLGTVISGNNSGDSTIFIDVGTLPSGSQVNVSYHTTIKAPFPTGITQIVNQGSVTSNELPPAPTDDPGTVLMDDPTTLPVDLPPVLDASKTSEVLVDADNNGLLGGGDTLRYTVVIVNADPLPATGVFFTDTPDPNTTLIAGSVQTSVGAVTTGNSAGDTTVRVDIGTLPAGASVTIVLDVLLNNPLPADITQVVNQGLANSNGQPPVPTDDLRTPDLDDETAETIPRPTTLGDSPEPVIQDTLTIRILLPLISR